MGRPKAVVLGPCLRMAELTHDLPVKLHLRAEDIGLAVSHSPSTHFFTCLVRTNASVLYGMFTLYYTHKHYHVIRKQMQLTMPLY